MNKTLISITSLLTAFTITSFAEKPDDSLLVHYPLDGNAKEALSDSNNAIATGTTPFYDRFGNKGKALHFGRDCNLKIPTESFNNISQSDFTLTFWFLANNNISRPTCTLVRAEEMNEGRHGITFWFGDAEATDVPFSLAAEVWTAGQNAFVVNDYPLNDDEWHHAALVREADKVSFYLDGKLIGTDRSQNPETATRLGDYLILGNGHDPYDAFFRNRFIGAFDDLRIYQRPLDSSEVVELFSDK